MNWLILDIVLSSFFKKYLKTTKCLKHCYTITPLCYMNKWSEIFYHNYIMKLYIMEKYIWNIIWPDILLKVKGFNVLILLYWIFGKYCPKYQVWCGKQIPSPASRSSQSSEEDRSLYNSANINVQPANDCDTDVML